ncbi:radical SAM family heme chaperone HemW [Spirulina sp. CS-785/01]|uniref:radical SAM family heme chaperone HemW n=1 Tax=Spirulina sp. CS-785/01 TaxID=3021716 RepID=UPI00232B2607|nr:radical SAM family heme chaperone HemW [Spirulina sp. CS-785/01]MDB9312747.1 radical SAM family heme chaperone HemW [Spirulina sp. CS-785/01]
MSLPPPIILSNNEGIDCDLPQSAYVHIPFCRRRCFYCDFPISVLGDRTSGEQSGSMEQYVDQLGREIRTTPNLGKPLKTVFFGGGTPSLLSPSQLERILTNLEQQFGIVQNAEISLEIDPGTFTLAQIRAYCQLGVNRLSLGVQAFQDDLLHRCGRSHQVKDILEAIGIIRQVGITNLSFDLISGLPEQTLQQWEESLQKALSFAPQHLSCYDLVLEPVTVFGKRYQGGETPLPQDETTAKMYCLAQEILTGAGFEHYEVSNYAKAGYQCVHNRVYWETQPYYGLGMGAASYTQGIRFTRPRTRREYYAWVEEGCQVGEERVTQQDQLLETLMLGLRLKEGVSLGQFDPKIKAKIEQTLHPYQQRGWVTLGEGVALTDPEGFLFSNTILASLFEQFDLEN